MMTFTNSNKDVHGNLVSEITYVLHEDCDIHETMQEFRRFLLAASFHPDTVEKYIEAE